MTVRYSSFFFLLLSFFISLSFAADPSCKSGIKFRSACCPKRCGQCGGPGCYKKSIKFKTRCCADGILRFSKSCNVVNPPCRIGIKNNSNNNNNNNNNNFNNNFNNNNNNNNNNKLSSTNGRWRYAPVNGGQLAKRHEACAVMVGGLVVLVGGRGRKPVSIYNPKTKVWVNKPGPGIEIHHFQCVVVQNKIWAISSWTGGFPYERNNPKIHIYDVFKNKWETRNGLPAFRNRGGGASAVRGDWIYLVAGNRGGHGAHATSLTWMDAYNWRNDYWTTPGTFPNMPGGGRDHVGGAFVNGELCVAGGRDGGQSGFFNLVKVDTYCFNFGTRKWSKRGNFPQGRAGAMTATTCDGRMMIAGGEGFGQAFKRVDVFNGQTWTRAPDMVHQRHGSGLAIANCNGCGHIFVPSGSGNIGGSPELFTTEEYIPNGSPLNCQFY